MIAYFTHRHKHESLKGIIMISDFLVVLMTTNLVEQVKFYKDLLQLELIFDNKDTIGLGKNGRIFIVLREDKAEDSHHLTKQKGPQIITFKCQGKLEQFNDVVKQAGYKVRDKLTIAEHNVQYLFIEDFDANEVCLDFPLSE